MLAHSPPLPLIIDHNDDLTAEDEEGIILALQHRERVRRIRLVMPVSSLQKLITAIDDEFPALEFLYLGPPTKHDSRLILPSKMGAPHLRHLMLNYFASPIGSRLLTTAVGLVRLFLRWIHPSTYPHPNHLLQQLSLLPQLERLGIGFFSPVPNHGLERQLSNTPIMTHATLPNIRRLIFYGDSGYLEALLSHMTTPLLERLGIQFLEQLNFSVPRLLQFMKTTENLRFSGAASAIFVFYHRAVSAFVFSPAGANLDIEVTSGHLDGQVSSMAQIFRVLSPLFPAVVDLTLDYRDHTLWHNQADRTRWLELLGSFRNVKTLRVHNGLVGEVSRSLRLDGEPHRELLLPELNELVCPAGSVNDESFAAFIHGREAAGQPVKLIGETFPVGRNRYQFDTPTGLYNIDPDPVSLR